MNSGGANSLLFKAEVKKINKTDRCVIKKRKTNTAESENGSSVLDISTSNDLYEAASRTALPANIYVGVKRGLPQWLQVCRN